MQSMIQKIHTVRHKIAGALRDKIVMLRIDSGKFAVRKICTGNAC